MLVDCSCCSWHCEWSKIDFSSIWHVCVVVQWVGFVVWLMHHMLPLSNANGFLSYFSSPPSRSHRLDVWTKTKEIYQVSPLMMANFRLTYELMNSIVWAFNWSALCKSARINVSAAVSTDRLTQSASSHITFNFSSAYWNNTRFK